MPISLKETSRINLLQTLLENTLAGDEDREIWSFVGHDYTMYLRATWATKDPATNTHKSIKWIVYQSQISYMLRIYDWPNICK